jgi:hypothetical protein
MATTVGESLGKMILGTGGMEETFNAILGVFADFLIGLGKAMITTATAIAGFQEALASMQWEVAVMLGIGAIAAGTILKSYVAKGPQFEEAQSYAEGGYEKEPTLAIVGDAKDRKGEWILNNSQMKSLIESTNRIQMQNWRALYGPPAMTSGRNEESMRNPEQFTYGKSITNSIISDSNGYIAETYIEARKLRILLKREETYQNRGK